MSANLPSHYVSQFNTNLQLLLQQKVSKLRASITEGSYSGKQASPVDQVGAISMNKVSGRFNAMGRVDAALDRRWVLPQDFDLPQLIDSFDKLKILVDPTGKYTENALAAANRQIDDLIIDAFFGDAKTGEEGGSNTSFLSGNQVAVNFGSASDVGLTVAKLKEAKRILMAHEVDLETDPIFAVVTAEQHDNLLNEVQIISTDFNDKPVLVEGRIMRFLGINFIHCERLDTDGSSYRRIPVYAKSGMHLGIWNEIQNSLSIRNDLQSEPYQIYTKMSMGATRIEEKKVVEIKCAE
jgi:anti-sigma28 factor (negative regulator of flagellin synthesis)